MTKGSTSGLLHRLWEELRPLDPIRSIKMKIAVLLAASGVLTGLLQLYGVLELGWRQRYSLAVDSARAHPEVPLLLAWGPNEVPDAGTLRAILIDAPHVHVAAHTPEARLRQVHDLIAASQTLEMIR